MPNIKIKKQNKMSFNKPTPQPHENTRTLLLHILDNMKNEGIFQEVKLSCNKISFQVTSKIDSDLFTICLDNNTTAFLSKEEVIQKFEEFIKYSNFKKEFIVGEIYNVAYMSLNGVLTIEKKMVDPPKKIVYEKYMKELIDGNHLKLYR